MAYPLEELRRGVLGIDNKIPLLDGSESVYVNFDNAASTPVARAVADKLNEFCPWYSSIHRGTGFKSWLSTAAYDRSHEIVGAFVGADPERDTVIFTGNTTESINKLARTIDFSGGRDTVLVSIMEHHSNDLPWRTTARTIHIPVLDDGTLDVDFIYDYLSREGERVGLVAVTGASNITGFINPVHDIARAVHDKGGRIAVDAAQLIPHRRVDMRPWDDPCHLDFVSFSAHKIYAPFGIGVLIGPKAAFTARDPETVGGGTVDCVCEDRIIWARLPDREEAGSPNVIGAVALAAAVEFIEKVGYDALAAHEAALTRSLLDELSKYDEIVVFGSSDPAESADRLGVVPFNFHHTSHGLAAAIMSYEAGIGVRNGCFCAHPYMKSLMGLDDSVEEDMVEYINRNDRSRLPGMIRCSFGFYNTEEELDRLFEIIRIIVEKEYSGEYRLSRSTGFYFAEGFKPDLSRYFSFGR